MEAPRATDELRREARRPAPVPGKQEKGRGLKKPNPPPAAPGPRNSAGRQERESENHFWRSDADYEKWVIPGERGGVIDLVQEKNGKIGFGAITAADAFVKKFEKPKRRLVPHVWLRCDRDQRA